MSFLIISILMPMKQAYLSMPIFATFVLVMGIGYIIGGIKSALIVERVFVIYCPNRMV